MTNLKLVPPAALRKTIDPIGEIERLANELWNEAGKPAGTTWENYWAEAEEQLTGGRSNAGKGGDSEKKSAAGNRSKARSDLSDSRHSTQAEILAQIEQTDDVLRSIVAAALKNLLTEHEAICLAYVLQTNEFVLKDSSRIPPQSRWQAAEVLAYLCNEYPSELLSAEAGGKPESLPFEKRFQYWYHELKAIKDRDRPLNYADQNTIRRLRDTLAAETRVEKLVFLD